MKNELLPMQSEHLTAVWQIEQQAHSHPWAESMVRDLTSRGACHYVLIDQQQRLLGYFYAQNIVGEVTLLNIAVAPQWQGKGIGRELIQGFLTICEQHGAESAWLEARASNQKALNLYQSEGFNEVDRRRDYYPANNGKEDAIIMSYLFFPA